MRVVDLFSGLGGWARIARERGHDVTTLDLDPRFGADVVEDVASWDPPAELVRSTALLVASPPCEAFSNLGARRNWNPDGSPRSSAAFAGLDAVAATLDLVARIEPRWWVLENPRAQLRRVVAERWPEVSATRRTVTYCAYGEPMQKPTDLWGAFPPSLGLAPPCRKGDPCHAPSPRGLVDAPRDSALGRRNRRGNLTMAKAQARALFGTSDGPLLAALRAAIPRALAETVLDAAERDLATELVGTPGGAGSRSESGPEDRREQLVARDLGLRDPNPPETAP